MALRWFAEQRCDLVIWETGLGGRLDATNIVTPIASVITNIGWDHQQWLGDTLDKIAAEKGGIIKPGVPVITAAEPGCGREVISEAARRSGSPLTIVKEVQIEADEGGNGNHRAESKFVSITDGTLVSPIPLAQPAARLPLPGMHQRRNAAVAFATVRALTAQLPVPPQAIASGLTTVQWPGRMQIVKLPDGRTLVLDGAHNADGAAALRDAFTEQFPGARPALLLGVLADKDWPAIVRALAPLASRIVLAPVSSERTLDPADMQMACAAASPSTRVKVCPSVSVALEQVAQAPLVLVAGSLYLIGEVMEHLGLSPVPPADERGLNEWAGGKSTS
jgi:dihydrofolate synthase/folylpolyglutamate synthase